MRKFIPAKKCIGPSQLSSVLGYNKWCSREELQKRLETGFWDTITDRMEFGIQYESVAVKFYEKYKKCIVKEAGFVKDGANSRFVGKADGLIDVPLVLNGLSLGCGGLEIKCHKDGSILEEIPQYYLVQVVAYMFLYQREWWDFMTCGFVNNRLKKCKITRIYWKDYKDQWHKQWYPQIIDFIKNVRWKF